MRTTRAALFIGAAFLALPAYAQDSQQVTPPPIMTTPAPAPAPQPQVVIQPSTPVVQSVPSVEEQQRGAAAADAPAPAPRRTEASRNATARSTGPARTAPAASRAAPAPAAQAPTPVEQPAAPAPEAASAPITPQAQTAPAPEAAPVASESSTTTTQSDKSASMWPWLLGGLALVIAGVAAFLFTRRRRNDEAVTTETYAEPVYAEPAYVQPAAEPVAAPDAAVIAEAPTADEPVLPREPSPAIAPVVAAAAPEQVEEAEIAEPREADLAGVADATAPVSRRPWIELGLRPVSAGTSEEEAVVDFELTVGNAGDTEARDVRISSFMLADEAETSDMERMLLEHRSDPIVPPVSIEPGDGARVDAHLAVPKGDLGRTFNPVVVAEARYTLPDGSEGRTAAAFRIGRPAYEGGLGAIGASRPHMVDDLAAELYGQPEHA